jgi:hypothetical protein
MTVDIMTVGKMTVDRMTVDRMTVDRMTVDRINVYKMTVDTITIDKMTVDKMTRCHLIYACPSSFASLMITFTDHTDVTISSKRKDSTRPETRSLYYKPFYGSYSS